MDASYELLRRLTRTLATEQGGTLTERLCRAFVRLVGADSATVTLGDAPGSVLFATDTRAERLEDLQALAREGPSIQARSGQAPVVLTDSALLARRWPTLAETLAAQAAGPDFPAVHAFPMRPQDVVLGVLTTYGFRQGELRLDLKAAQFLANAVGVALLGTLRQGDPASPDDVDGALDDERWLARDQISQATGMVVAQLRLPSADALAVLRAHAYAEDTTLSAVSRRVVDRQLRFTDPRDQSP